VICKFLRFIEVAEGKSRLAAPLRRLKRPCRTMRVEERGGMVFVCMKRGVEVEWRKEESEKRKENRDED